MKVLTLFWNTQPGSSLKDTIPADILESINIIEANGLDEVKQALTANPQIAIVVISLHSADIESLYHIQYIQQHYPDKSLLAIFQNSDQATSAIHALRLLTNGLKTSAIEDQSADNHEADSSKGRGKRELRLTPRQIQVLNLLMNGNSNKAIAKTLDLSEGTVKIHCMAIFKQLGVNNRTQAAVRAEQIMPQLEAMLANADSDTTEQRIFI